MSLVVCCYQLLIFYADFFQFLNFPSFQFLKTMSASQNEGEEIQAVETDNVSSPESISSSFNLVTGGIKRHRVWRYYDLLAEVLPKFFNSKTAADPLRPDAVMGSVTDTGSPVYEGMIFMGFTLCTSLLNCRFSF